jgi:predicted ATPase/class 3 adenylate cyclase
MDALPSGTVSLLFSDIEGSTLLLSRLGADYAKALDGQRRVLRKAWVEHGGTELGTEGDSFFVVFPTAEGAVSAAAQAQRELAAFDWPDAVQVRVRMGVHTGTPAVHDGGYVGMDVHRAARMAASAHGGQVVVSQATAHLVDGSLPIGVQLRDLGSHQLKDLPTTEHLFQLAIDGLPAQFPPLKTLGAASSLPRPVTPLVGRDGELAELSRLLFSREVRLVTLTGPGGSGKTRLAVGLAQQLIERFADGVYFVPLASDTSADVIWTSIGEVLDLPPEGRMPPRLFTHVAPRAVLFVLDNLEQLHGADDVVAELLDHAPQVVVIATSRRPLRIPGEYDHAVPPLELPKSGSVDQVEEFGAVRMFVEHAKMAKSSFHLTEDNTADVVQVCRRLDGLPLAIEVAATRIKLLTPRALLARLDTALDLAAGGHRPSRQQTLRNTIAWSYQLLTPPQQAFFRRLGVFAGGADLDAVTAVTSDILDGADPLDLVAELNDASLTIIAEGADGEPRIGMLETIRSYARDQLQAAGELDKARRIHCEHYRSVAQELSLRIGSAAAQLLDARRRLEVELDNFREALDWALEPGELLGSPSEQQVRMGQTLCAQLCDLWKYGGHYAEARRWCERAVSLQSGPDTAQLGRCLAKLSDIARVQGDIERAREAAMDSVAVWRRLGRKHGLPESLNVLGRSAMLLGDLRVARSAFAEALSLSEEINDLGQKLTALTHLANMENMEGNFERSVELDKAAAATHLQLGNTMGLLVSYHNIACALRDMGRPEEAHRKMSEQIPQLLRLAGPEGLMTTGEDYGAVLADLGEYQHAIRLLGAVDAMRERNGTPRDLNQQTWIGQSFATARAAMPDKSWDQQYQAGRTMTVEQALTEANAATAELRR